MAFTFAANCYTRLTQFAIRQIWNTPETLLDLFCELDQQFCTSKKIVRDVSFTTYKNEIFLKLKELDQDRLDLLYNSLSSVETPENMLSSMIRRNNIFVVQLLLTENCSLLDQGCLSVIFTLTTENSDPRMLTCLSETLATRLLAGTIDVTAPNLLWKKWITYSMCASFDQLLTAHDSSNLTEKAWELLGIVAKAKALFEGKEVPKCSNEALAHFLTPAQETFLAHFFAAGDKDDCIEKIDATAKAILQRGPKPLYATSSVAPTWQMLQQKTTKVVNTLHKRESKKTT